MYHHKGHIRFLLFPLVLSNGVQAQDLNLDMLYGDHETVSIATGAKTPIHLAPSVASVITAEDIKAMGATALDEVLESVPGLHIGLSVNRLNSNYTIRGINTSQTPQVLLLLNGIPVRQLFSGSRPNNLRMPVSNIKRIEVIRGPGSAVYGADAFAGVINVITYQAGDNINTGTGLRGGSFDRKGGWFTSSNRLGDWKMVFNIETDQSDGDRGRVVNSDLQTTFDTLYGTSASNAPGALDTRYDILTSQLSLGNRQWTIDLWQYQNKDAGIGPGIAQALDPTGKQDTELYQLNALYKSDHSGAWSWEGQGSYLYYKSRPSYTIFPAGSRLPIGSDGNVDASSLNLVYFPDGLIANPHGIDKQATLEFRTFYLGWRNHSLRAALGAQQHKFTASSTQNFGPGVIDGTTPSPIDGSLTDLTGTPYIFIPDKERRIVYLSLQDEWQFQPDWMMTYGARFDDYSDFGSTLNPRLALVWSMDYNLTSKLLYGKAFRAPSFSELYAINNPAILGNPNLEPETIDTIELVFDYRINYSDQLQLGLFKYDIDDLIQYVPDSSGTSSTAQNTTGIDGYGYELEAHWSITNNLLINSNYSWQLSRYKSTQKPVADAPQQQFYIETRWRFISQWYIDLEAYRVFDRQRPATDTRPAIADYSWVNLTLRHSFSNTGWELAGSIRNLTDEDAREPSNSQIVEDYPLEGRNYYLEIRYTWQK